jgi:hypothetical protein
MPVLREVNIRRRDGHMLPETRATPDMCGRQVDVYPAAEDTPLSVVMLDMSRANESLLRYDVFAVMNSISMCESRLRNRDFPVYLCKWTSGGRRHVGIGLPIRFPTKLHLMFQGLIRAHMEIIEISDGLAIDVGAQPFMLYNHGQLIAYGDPFDGIPISPDDSVEIRSAEFKAPAPKKAERFPLPKIRWNAPERHSIETWQEVRQDILKFIWSTIGPGTFFSLQREMKEQFGIAVKVLPTSVAGQQGWTSVGWVSRENQDCTVTVYVNKDLPDQLKYVVLAHELAHYAVHFPVLLAGRMIEQVSWLTPHAGCLFRNAYERYLGTGEQLEEQADLLAVHLLIPPQNSADAMSRFVSVVGGQAPYGDDRIGADVVTWIQLSDLFPERSSVRYSWHNYNEMVEVAEREIAWARSADAANDATLYGKMLRAALRREDPDAKRESQRVNRVVFDFWEQIDDVSELSAVCGQDHSEVGGLPYLDDRSGHGELLDPISGERENAPRIPLVPASPGRLDGLWVNVLDPRQKPASVAEWRQRYPALAAALYPVQVPPEAPVFGTIAE